MNKDEIKALFTALHEDRLKAVPKSFATEGIWDEQVEKYSEKAHFIYEVIQNADDSEATEARFELKKDRLVFRHNGKVHFSITPVATEHEDFKKGRLGSLNSITAVAKSTKGGGNAIGKFGVGFKSVFRYTETPFIYDDELKFSIKNYIVPDWEPEDYPGRDAGWTVFVFDFNRQPTGNEAYKVPSSEEAYVEIREKLRSLVMPTLFLRTLERVTYSCEDGCSGSYAVEIVKKWDGVSFDDIVPMDVKEVRNLRIEDKNIAHDDRILIFSRGESPLEKYSIGYMLGADDKRVKACIGFTTFCFFPTQQDNGLKFLVHGPFKLNPARETITEGEPHNDGLVSKITTLVADSFPVMVELGRREDRVLYDDRILEVLPIHKQSEQPRKIFEPVFLNSHAFPKTLKDDHKILESFVRRKILPAGDGHYVKKQVAFFAETDVLRKTFPNSILAALVDKAEAVWIFPGYNEQQVRGNDGGKAFLRNCIQQWVDQQFVLDKLTGKFIEERDDSWLQSFYDFVLNGEKKKWGLFAQRQIFKSVDETAVPASDKHGEPCLFLPNAEGRAVQGFPTVKPSLVFVPDSPASRYLRELGITRPTPKDEILSMIGELNKDSSDDHIAAFQLIFEGLRTAVNQTDRREIMIRLAESAWLVSSQKVRKTANELYFESDLLRKYFDPLSRGDFLDVDAYRNSVQEDLREEVVSFFMELGVSKWPRLKSIRLSKPEFVEGYMRTRNAWKEPTCYRVDDETWEEIEIEGLRELILTATRTDIKVWRDRALVIWKILQNLLSNAGEDLFPDGRHVYFKNSLKSEEFSNYLLYLLKTIPWLYSPNGELLSPACVKDGALAVDFTRDSDADRKVRKLLGVKEDILSPEDDEILKIVRDLRSGGRSNDEVKGLLTSGMSAIGAGETGCENEDVERKVWKHVSKLVNADQEDPYLNLSEEFEKDLKSAQKYDKAPPEVGAENVMKVLDFLAIPNLRIPDYQRPYKWTKRSVLELLGDIDKMVIARCQEDNVEPSAVPYRVGTIVLNKKKDETGDQEYYDIVDGQQRTITFTLLALGVGLNLGHISKQEFYPALSQSLESQRNLHNNMVYICEYLKSRTEENTDYIKLLNEVLAESLEVVVICVETQEEAFQLFDSQNTRGRPLAPHDLLKAYHLRLMKAPKGASKEEKEEFERKESERVGDWENLDSNVIGDLFQDVLYPIYRWSRKEKCNVFSARDIYVFKGVPLGYKNKYGYVDRVCVTDTHFQIGDDFTPGECFFEYVKHYLEMKGEIEKQLADDRYAPVKRVMESFGSPYARNLFYAVLMAYFDRFGFGIPPKDKDDRRAVIKLCLWAYSVCLDLANFGAKTPNKYAIGLPDGNDRYSNQKAMFYLIRNAVFHTDVTKIAVEHSKRENEQFTGKRVALQQALKELK